MNKTRNRKVGKVNEGLWKAMHGTKGFGTQVDFARAFKVSPSTIQKAWRCNTFDEYLEENITIREKVYEYMGRKPAPTLFEANKLKEEEFLAQAKELGYEVVKTRKRWPLGGK